MRRTARVAMGLLVMGGAMAPPPTAEAAVDRRPQVERRVSAEYPAWARGAGLGTSVELRVQVGKDGRARRVVVVPYSVGRDLLSRRLRASFDSAAVAAVRRWTFRPAESSGRPVVAWTRVEVLFEDPGAAARPDTADTVGRGGR